MNFDCRSSAKSLVMASLLFAVALARGAETNNVADGTNSNADLRVILQLQEQIQATKQALERNHEETERLTAKNAEQLATMNRIETALREQRDRDFKAIESTNQAMESTNRLLLIVAGSFAGVGFIAMLVTAYLQWRAVNRLAEFTALLPGAGRAAFPGRAEPQLLGSGTAEQANTRLFGALSTLEKRILELEHATHVPLPASSPPTNGTHASEAAVVSGPEEQIALLLAKGESLLNLDKAEEALACYDEILAHHPDHPEALVKKGVALEQLRKMDDALHCYDQAIAADGSLTVAYLQKGGLFNRLERYEEALQCYEQALRTQEKVRES